MTVLARPAIDDAVEFERVWLDERSWVDVARHWLSGSDALYDAMLEHTPWRTNRLWRYERWVEEPRLYGSARAGGQPVHAVLPELHRALNRRYGVEFGGLTAVAVDVPAGTPSARTLL